VIVDAGAVRVGARELEAARTRPPSIPKLVRAAPPLPPERQVPAPSGESQRELPGGLHLHFHRVDAADVAAIIGQQQDGLMTEDLRYP